MKLRHLTIIGSLFLIQLSFLTNINAESNGIDDSDYSDPNGNTYENGHVYDYPETTDDGNMISTISSTNSDAIIMEDANDMDIGESHANNSDVPLPIIIVFVFMFTMLGVICIQQLQRMFAENKEYDNIKFDIRENRATSRSGKTYGTVSMKDKNKNKNKNGKDNTKDKETQMGDSSFQNSRTVTVYSDTDEKVEEMNIATKVRKKFSLSKYKVVGEARETSSSDECIELGSGYDTNTMNNNDNNDENTNMNNNQQQQSKNNNGNEKGKKARKKIREQVIVATKGLKDKIDEIEKKLHGSKLNSKKNRYKGYGSLKQINNKNGNYDDDDDIDDATDDEDEDNDNVSDGQVDKNKQKDKENMSDDSDVKHAGYGMNYGYSEDYDCDFEDSDTQLSEEGDDKPNETVVKRIALE